MTQEARGHFLSVFTLKCVFVGPDIRELFYDVFHNQFINIGKKTSSEFCLVCFLKYVFLLVLILGNCFMTCFIISLLI